MKTIWIIVAVLVVLGLGWYFYGQPLGIRYEKPNNSPPAELPLAGTPTPTTASNQETSAKFDVLITSAGFSPSVINIKKGTTIVFTNNDTVAHWPASNPHPAHTDFPAFNSKPGIPTGGTYSFTTDTAVSFGFHDHLNPTLKGQINITD
ncbi:MAG: cupredoxin domain-containing protein [bacterium]|nr:cupredoxin domain-containing protein [bacterium]